MIQFSEGQANMLPWWGTQQEVSKRLRQEYTAMRATFSSTFRLVRPERVNDLMYWVGEVEINLVGVRWKTFTPQHTLKILYPADYPYRPAEAYVLQPEIYSQKHQYEDGQLCLFNPKDGENYGWNPASSTAVTVAGWAIEWIYSYYIWRDTGIWPGVEADHQAPGRASRPVDDGE
jgi:ubiquitin-protein ligase